MPAALHELHQGGRQVFDITRPQGWSLLCQRVLVKFVLRIVKAAQAQHDAQVKQGSTCDSIWLMRELT